MATAIVIALFALAAAGFLLARGWALVLPLLVVPLLYLGADHGWWGNGLGDGWQFAMVLILFVALLATAAGVTVRRLF